MGLQPNLIISSPRLRTRQTAEITAELLGCEKRLEFNDVLGKNYSPGAALNMLTTLNSHEVVILVGHKPDLSVLGGLLLGPSGGPALKFHKSAVLGLSFPRLPRQGEGVLAFFFPPENLLALV
jgi:phosphohistidine phosphatase